MKKNYRVNCPNFDAFRFLKLATFLLLSVFAVTTATAATDPDLKPKSDFVSLSTTMKNCFLENVYQPASCGQSRGIDAVSGINVLRVSACDVEHFYFEIGGQNTPRVFLRGCNKISVNRPIGGNSAPRNLIKKATAKNTIRLFADIGGTQNAPRTGDKKVLQPDLSNLIKAPFALFKVGADGVPQDQLFLIFFKAIG